MAKAGCVIIHDEIRIRQGRYMNDRIEQDHRRIKRRIRSMLGFKSQASAAIIVSGNAMIHIMRKGQARHACNPSIVGQFGNLAD
jgi:transposase-like protein